MKYLFESKQILGSLSRGIAVSRRHAIRQKCINCSGFSMADVRDCAHDDCDLYPFRSGVGYQSPVERDKAIRKHCRWCMGENINEVRDCPSNDCALYPHRLPKKALRRREQEHIEGGVRDNIPEAIPEHVPEVRP